MKRVCVGWIVASVAAVAGCDAKVPESQVGRFQIISVERTLAEKGGAAIEWKEALLLDTVTGRTWAASAAVDKNPVWLPFETLTVTP